MKPDGRLSLGPLRAGGVNHTGLCCCTSALMRGNRDGDGLEVADHAVAAHPFQNRQVLGDGDVHDIGGQGPDDNAVRQPVGDSNELDARQFRERAKKWRAVGGADSTSIWKYWVLATNRLYGPIWNPLHRAAGHHADHGGLDVGLCSNRRRRSWWRCRSRGTVVRP